MVFRLEGRRVWVCGHRGMVGSAIMRRLERASVSIQTASRAELDLTRQSDVEEWMAAQRPEVVFIAAARVGGIFANSTYPVDFLYDNLMIEANVISAARHCGVAKLIFLGSSCIYPRLAPQPISEEQLLTGPLEPTNQWYAIAKIAGIKLCQAYRRQYGLDFISVMPTNLYGPFDNFHPDNSHVIPGLMRRIDEAKQEDAARVVVWGSGQPMREFLHVDDLADAAVFLADNWSDEEHINVGTGVDVTIHELAHTLARVIGYRGDIVFDPSKPDGMPRKLLDIARIRALGWQPSISLEAGLADTYRWYQAQQGQVRH